MYTSFVYQMKLWYCFGYFRFTVLRILCCKGILVTMHMTTMMYIVYCRYVFVHEWSYTINVCVCICAIHVLLYSKQFFHSFFNLFTAGLYQGSSRKGFAIQGRQQILVCAMQFLMIVMPTIIIFSKNLICFDFFFFSLQQ